MTTEERLDKMEKELHRARRFNRWLVAAVGLSLGAWLLAGTYGPREAGAQDGAGASKAVPAEAIGAAGVPRYQISSISPGDSSSIYQAFVLDTRTGRVQALLSEGDAATFDRETAAKNRHFHFVWRTLAEAPK